MKKIQRYNIISICLLVALTSVGCKKQNDFLNQKTNEALSTISSISDLQELLNNEGLFNEYSDPGLGENETDDYHITYAFWSSLDPMSQNLYIWNKTIYVTGTTCEDWDQTYQEVYYANTVLDALPNITAPQTQLNDVKGQALFKRAWAFYNLVQTFALPYNPATANTDLGIPLRLNSNLNLKSVRATEEQCYNQIISDVQTAIHLLPVTSGLDTRPDQVDAYAFLARIYLAMGDYTNAYKYSNACLNLNGVLFDYNNLIPTNYYLTSNSQYPLDEDLYHATLQTYELSEFSKAIVDSNLYNMYDNNDIRKTAFFQTFQGAIRFKGSYEIAQFGQPFSGLATDEMYLIRAESNARLGNTANAMVDLNALLVKRYITGTYVQRTAASSQDALTQILTERRKELCFRGLRWTDLRRLNQDPNFAITLTRNLNGTIYTLPPNDPRYALPIPDDEIASDGLQQNAR